MRSASLIVLSRCATSTTVLPARAVLRFCWIAALGGGVEVAGRLVEDQDLRLPEQGPGDRQPLPLAARRGSPPARR